ncbi:MAG: hypothetical protein ACYC67_10510 [Prosthecobacter sp.]
MSMTPEDTRFEVRRFLAARPTASLAADAITHHLKRLGLETTQPEVEAALTFLMGLDPAQVMGTITSLGSTKRYQISSAGQLAYERNE